MPRRPFGPALDQRFVFPSLSYVTAVAEVRHALQQREGLVVVTGELVPARRCCAGRFSNSSTHQCSSPLCSILVLRQMPSCSRC